MVASLLPLSAVYPLGYPNKDRAMTRNFQSFCKCGLCVIPMNEIAVHKLTLLDWYAKQGLKANKGPGHVLMVHNSIQRPVKPRKVVPQ